MSPADGIQIGFAALGCPPEEIIALARKGEELGYRRIQFGDHLAEPAQIVDEDYPYGPRPRLQRMDYIDPLVQAAGVASSTSTITIATAVFLLPMHHPLLIVRALSTLQRIATGRFMLGVGAGWMREEFEALGIPFASRGRRFDEALEVIRAGQMGGEISFEGKIFSFGPMTVSELPISVPIIVGGTTDVALRRAARYGDGWYSTPDLDVAGLVAARERIEGYRSSAGTAGRPFAYHISLRQPDPGLLEALVAEGFRSFAIPSYTLFPRDRTPPFSWDEKLASLESAAEALGIVPGS